VERERGEKVGVAGTESMILVDFLLLFVCQGGEDGVRVVVSGGGEGVDSTEVDEDGPPGVEIREGYIPRALGARRECDLFLAWDTHGTKYLS
jgi:hypothetical protein